MEDIYKEYLKEIDKDIEWHDKRAVEEKKRNTYYKMISTVLAASIPVLTLIGAYNNTMETAFCIIAAIFAAAVTVIQAYLQIKQPERIFILYRLTWESLRQEKYKFLSSSGDYKGKPPEEQFQIFNEHCCNILDHTDETSMAAQQSRT